MKSVLLKREKIPKGIRYLLVGIGAGLTYQCSFMLTQTLPLVYGNLIAVIMSSFISYFGHHSMTFMRRGNHWHYLPRFAFQLTLSYIVSTAILKGFLAYHYHYFYGIATVWITLPLLNFIAMEFWTFFKPSPIDQEVKAQRFCWPKSFTPLSQAEQKAGEDFMKYWHTVLPSKYSVIKKFNHQFPLISTPSKDTIRTLEISTGLGQHLLFESLENQKGYPQDYYCLESRKQMGEELKKRHPHVNLIIGDCQQRLNFSPAFFDRILAIYVLEHLPNLPSALKEMARLLKPKGTFSVVIPCDPGLAYQLARKICAERLFSKRYNMPYQPIIRREHINSPAEILYLLKKTFTIEKKTYFPLKIPSTHLNLCIGLHLTSKSNSKKTDVNLEC